MTLTRWVGCYEWLLHNVSVECFWRCVFQSQPPTGRKTYSSINITQSVYCQGHKPTMNIDVCIWMRSSTTWQTAFSSSASCFWTWYSPFWFLRWAGRRQDRDSNPYSLHKAQLDSYMISERQVQGVCKARLPLTGTQHHRAAVINSSDLEIAPILS